MAMNNNELMKLFDFILENKKIILGDNKLFSRDTLIILRGIVKGKLPNDFTLTKEQEKLIIDAFLNSNNIFNDETPNIILKNQDCINAAIERNINSADSIEEFTPELSEKVLKLALSKKYILTRRSPKFLKENYVIAINSIRKEPDSANYVEWDSFKKENYENLIEETIKAGYELSPYSCYQLKENPDVALNSIKKNIKTLDYCPMNTQHHPEIFNYLISIGREYYGRSLKNRPIFTFTNYDNMKYALKKLEIFDKEDEDFTNNFDYEIDIDNYIEKTTKLYVDGINTFPTIENFNTIFQVCANLKWEEYRNENLDDYANIFGKICTELKNNKTYLNAIADLDFLEKMKETLDDKYNLLRQAMEQYHTIIHSKKKLSNLNDCRDQIAKLSALYVSISKENYKKQKLEYWFEDIKNYFIPKKDHPVIYKKILDYKHKELFKDLYQNKDKNICEFINNIVKQYSDNINEETILSMIDNFLINDYSKLDSFIKAPKGWNNHKRYKEASKLINRLNKNYIKYTDLEVVRYLDIIKYNESKKEYYYAGPSFDEESILRYNEYQKKLQIFDKIKQQIIFKSKKLEMNIDIDDEELNNIAEDLPFNDEFFTFDKSSINLFDLEDFEDSVLNGYIIDPDSILDDEAYNLLTKYSINNGLFWMLLLLNKYKNYSLYDIGIDKETILSTFDYMQETVKLAKMLNYDINKYEDILTLCQLSEYADEETIAILGAEVINKLCKYREYTNENAQDIVRIAQELFCEMIKRDKSTVPYVSGETNNYKYSIYDSQDETILLAGINTDACFRIDGNDNDFLHYCALNKNGFVIKITDTFGNFIGRAAGFRNGNGVYINQLRTIYDEGGEGYQGDYINEQLEIIETFKKACEDIVKTSQNNANEKDKINFVVATQSYALEEVESNVSESVEEKIGDVPMEKGSIDWINFVKNTKNLQELDDPDDTFSTDFGNYSLICMASIKKNLKVKDIKRKDVEAVYIRPRNKILITTNPDINIFNKINKINGVYSHLNCTYFENTTIDKNSVIFIGDNWYIIYNNGKIVDSCLLDFDNNAKIEFNATEEVIKNNLIESNNQINYEEILEKLQNQIPETKTLKLKN